MVWLDNTRIFAIFAVVFLHAAAAVVIGFSIGTPEWWVGNIYDSIVRWCVPVFVMISGALLLDPTKNDDLKTFYTKRLSKILVPVLFWTVVYLCHDSYVTVLKGGEPTFDYLLGKLMSGKPHYHMWFLSMIIVLYVFTPFLKKIVANSTKQELMVFIIVSFVLAMINNFNAKFLGSGTGPFINWFLYYVPFFFLGYLIRVDEKKYSKTLLWGVFIVTSAITAYACYYFGLSINSGAGLYFYEYLSITVIPMSISVMYLLKLWNKPIYSTNTTKLFSALTLGVYLVHPIILEAMQRAGFGPQDFNPIISIPLITIFVYFASAFVSWILQKTPYLKRVI